jgi:hypothetical protein
MKNQALSPTASGKVMSQATLVAVDHSHKQLSHVSYIWAK